MRSCADVSRNRKHRGPAVQQVASATVTDHCDPSGYASATSPHAEVSEVPRDRQQLFPGQRWFAVQCQPKREQRAAIQLRNQEFRTFLPLRLKAWRHARRVERRQVPFFPGYIFIALDLERDRWRNVNGTYGVQRIVTAGVEGRPMPLPRGVIEALQGEADERGCLRREELVRAGQAVRILHGPFGDRICELIGLDDAGRVRVLIELLGGRFPVALSRDQVTAAG